MQVKRDLASGSMPCQEHTAVLLASYVVQGEYGRDKGDVIGLVVKGVRERGEEEKRREERGREGRGGDERVGEERG